MKTLTTTILSLCVLLAFAQTEIQDSVSISPGYTSMSFYSLANGEQGNIPATNWDIQFVTNARSAGIRINDAAGAELFELPNSAVSNWSTTDTTGMLAAHNTDTSWQVGAFNLGTNNLDNYGWGTYDFVSHNVQADKFFIIKMVSGDYKKIMIDGLLFNNSTQTQSYAFRYADLDNSNETMDTFIVTNYAGKTSVYYSLSTDQLIDNEPAKDSWDIVFRKYITDLGGGFYYAVTGALTNEGITSAEARGVPASINSGQGYSHVSNISNIGFDWKDFNMNSFMWELEDSLVYFVASQTGDIYKLVFTDFGGATDGKIYFNKTMITQATGIQNVSNISKFTTYPNPASNEMNILFTMPKQDKVELIVTDLAGRTVEQNNLNAKEGLNNVQLNLELYNSGYYLVTLRNNSFSTTNRFVKSN